MKQIIIGREGNQPFTITDDYVSRRHAIFTYDDVVPGNMTLTDISSSGTFVRIGNQFQQVSQCNVDATTEVRLGPKYTFRISSLFQPVQQQPPQKGTKTIAEPQKQRADIGNLRKVAEAYERTKVELEQKQANINSLRGLSLAGSFAAAIISPIITSIVSDNMTDGKIQWYYQAIGPAIAFIFLVSLMVYCSKASKDVIVRKNANEKNYKMRFCCPRCHVPFAGKLYENILVEGKCPKCKTEFYDSK